MAAIRCVVGGRENAGVLQHRQHMTADNVNLADAVNFIAKEFNPQGVFMLPCRNDLHRIPPDTEGAPAEVHIIPFVLNIDQVAKQFFTAHGHPGAKGNHLPLVFAGVAHGVDTAYGCHNDDILPLPQGGGSAVAKPVNLFVDGGILFDVCIRRGNVGLRLIVIVIRDEVFHPAIREESLQFAAQLGSKSLVVGNHQSGLLHLFNHRGHGKGFAGTCYTQQHLALHAFLNASAQCLNGLWLIAAGLVWCL